VFLKYVDTSTENTDLLEIFDHVVIEVGPENIVQFITDIDARYKAAVKILEERYGTFVWSPCAARCIDLMLENFADPKYCTFLWSMKL
jgi:acetolactate synthase small subunit